MPTSTDIVLVCHLHGDSPAPIEIDGIKFCSRCLKERLLKGEGGVVEIMWMEAVDHTYGEPETNSPRHTCLNCTESWLVSSGTSCPKCGTGVTS